MSPALACFNVRFDQHGSLYDYAARFCFIPPVLTSRGCYGVVTRHENVKFHWL